MIRNNFTKCDNKVKTLIPNITQLPVNVFTNELMNSSAYFQYTIHEMHFSSFIFATNFVQKADSTSAIAFLILIY